MGGRAAAVVVQYQIKNSLDRWTGPQAAYVEVIGVHGHRADRCQAGHVVGDVAAARMHEGPAGVARVVVLVTLNRSARAGSVHADRSKVSAPTPSVSLPDAHIIERATRRRALHGSLY